VSRRAAAVGLAPLQPLAIAITQVLWFYARNVGETAPTDMLRSLVLSGGASLVVWALASAGLRDTRRGAVFASAVAFLFWTTTSMPGGAAVAGVIWLVSLSLLFVWLQRSTRPLTGLYRVIDFVAVAGVLVPLAGLAIASSGGTAASAQKLTAGYRQALHTPPEIYQPDVYLIVLDGHGRDDELAEYFDIEQGLGAALEERGFYVAQESQANYSATLQALPSILNFSYLPELDPNPTIRTLTRLVKDNRLVATLREKGYRFISYASGLELTEFKRADIYLEPPAPLALFGWPLRPNYFEQGLLAWTPFDAALRRSATLSPYTQHRERILFALRDLPRHARDPGPTLVLAHVMSPHEPFVFGANGEDVSPREEKYDISAIFEDPTLPTEPGRTGPAYARLYREQTVYLGQLVQRTVDEILRRSPEPPIIIILGDHGPRGFSPNIRHSRLAILNALYLPDGGDSALYPSITPVNAMRVVLNRYFGQRLPLLTDESFRVDWAHPSVYTPVDIAPQRAAGEAG